MKKIKNITIFLIAITLLSGCSENEKSFENNSNTHGDEEPVEIRVVTSYGGDDGNRQNYENAYKAYESVSGNIVRDSSEISNEEWKTKVMKTFENGTEPDVLFYFSGVDSEKIVADGKVVSLDEIRTVYPDYASNMDENKMIKSSVDGKIYSIPVNGYWEGLFVNKKVLQDCGVEIPNADTSWDEFIEDCIKIVKKGYVPIAASISEVPHYWFEFCVFNNGTAIDHHLIPKALDDNIAKTWIDGLNDMKELFTKGFFPGNTLTAASSQTDVLMIDNRAAFMIDGSWKVGWFAENAADINDFTVTYVPSKGERKPTDIIGGISMGYYITRKAWDDPKKQAACIEFVKAMTTGEVVATFGMTSVTALKEPIPAPSDASSFIKDALKMTTDLTNVAPAAGDNLSPEVRSRLFSNISKIVTEEMSAEEAIKDCI